MKALLLRFTLIKSIFLLCMSSIAFGDTFTFTENIEELAKHHFAQIRTSQDIQGALFTLYLRDDKSRLGCELYITLENEGEYPSAGEVIFQFNQSEFEKPERKIDLRSLGLGPMETRLALKKDPKASDKIANDNRFLRGNSGNVIICEKHSEYTYDDILELLSKVFAIEEDKSRIERFFDFIME